MFVVPYIFRSILYIMFGLTIEVVFSVVGIEWIMGATIPNKRLSKKYLEGFVSLWMVPLYGLGMFGAEVITKQITSLPIFIRYLIWCVVFAGAEALYGFMCDWLFGAYAWDYYKLSDYKIFKRGYTLYTLIPVWGLAGLCFEYYSKLLIYLSPYVIDFMRAM